MGKKLFTVSKITLEERCFNVIFLILSRFLFTGHYPWRRVLSQQTLRRRVLSQQTWKSLPKKSIIYKIGDSCINKLQLIGYLRYVLYVMTFLICLFLEFNLSFNSFYHLILIIQYVTQVLPHRYYLRLIRSPLFSPFHH